MLLSDLIDKLDYIKIQGDLNIEIDLIAYDSRDVVENSLFVAIEGFIVDGHGFIDMAIENGAIAVISEKDVVLDDTITLIKVNNSRKAIAQVAANYYNHPTSKLNMIGITGTNGKTSTSYLIKSIFDHANKTTGVIGTIGTVIGDTIIKNKNTTPESLNLQEIFSKMLEYNVKNCIMEVSSHALSLNRVASCSFNTGIFTNLSPDHLELHNTMEEYFNEKSKLFKLTKDYNIINADDEYGKRLIKESKEREAKIFTYGIKNDADIYATDIRYSLESTNFIAHTPKGSIDIKINMPGNIYVYNSLAAIACAYLNGIGLQDIQKGIYAVKSIKGRFEIVYNDDDFKVIVDFAHTEDGLEKALTTIKPFTKRKIILVFGVYAAEGEKGRGKRRAMGKVAAKYADIAIVTSDNPKEQNPHMIIREIVEAIEENNGNYKTFVDRKEAIQYAIEISEKGDTVLIAGKGHETSQVIGKKEIPFNETEIVIEFIKNATDMKIG